jgi:hypothetical protein
MLLFIKSFSLSFVSNRAIPGTLLVLLVTELWPLMQLPELYVGLELELHGFQALQHTSLLYRIYHADA